MLTVVLTIIAYVIFALAPLTQMRKVMKTKMSDEIALGWPLLFIAGMFLIIPGIVRTGDPSLIIGHLSGLAANLLNLGFILKFRHPRPHP